MALHHSVVPLIYYFFSKTKANKLSSTSASQQKVASLRDNSKGACLLSTISNARQMLWSAKRDHERCYQPCNWQLTGLSHEYITIICPEKWPHYRTRVSRWSYDNESFPYYWVLVPGTQCRALKLLNKHLVTGNLKCQKLIWSHFNIIQYVKISKYDN